LIVTPNVASEEDIDKLIMPDDLPNEQPTFKAYIEAKVFGKEGHIIQYYRQPMKSLTQYFLALMSIPLLGTYQNASTNQATGILTNILGLPNQLTNVAFGATIAWNWSIQLGSGTQTFSPSLNKLAAPIANGSGAGQLVYGAVSISYSGSSISISVTVTNNTSGGITVTEIGLTCTLGLFYSGNSSNTYNYLLSYDTFSQPITISAGASATFQITLSFSG